MMTTHHLSIRLSTALSGIQKFIGFSTTKAACMNLIPVDFDDCFTKGRTLDFDSPTHNTPDTLSF